MTIGDLTWPGVVLAGFGLGAFVLRTSIATAINHQANKAIEERKGRLGLELETMRQTFKLDLEHQAREAARAAEDRRGLFEKDLERMRHDFGRELDRDRQVAAAALEQFKTSLSLEAEVRRQIASRKVDVVGKIVAAGFDVMHIGFYGAPEHKDAVMASITSLLRVLLQNAHLFSASTVDSFQTYSAECLKFHNANQGFTPEAVERLEAATKEVVKLARTELHVDDAPAVQTQDRDEKAS